MTKREASFLEAQNSREAFEAVVESKGWIVFFLEKEIQCGRLSVIYKQKP
jgi:hypothetical protein